MFDPNPSSTTMGMFDVSFHNGYGWSAYIFMTTMAIMNYIGHFGGSIHLDSVEQDIYASYDTISTSLNKHFGLFSSVAVADLNKVALRKLLLKCTRRNKDYFL